MKKYVLAAAAVVALASAANAAEAKEKKVVAPVSIDAPAVPVQPIVATYPAGVVPTAPSIAAGSALPANSEITVRINSELNSKTMRVGDTFSAIVARDVMLGNVVVIPMGSPVNGVITWRTGKGAFGKSAKMEYEIRSLDVAGQRLPVLGKFRQEGKGNTGAAVGAVVAVGVFGAFVTGKSAIVEQGRELKVFTTTAIPVSLPVASVAAAPAQPAEATLTPVVATTPAK